MTIDYKKISFYSLIFICVICLVSSLSSNITIIPIVEEPSQCTCKIKGSCKLKPSVEHFSNDQLFSYKDTNKPGYSYYQTTALTALDNADGNPSNILFGQANRLIEAGTPHVFHLNVYCNLYVINGNPFGQDKIQITETSDIKNQKYNVYLENTSNNTRILLDSLKKDNDGIYKLNYVSNNVNELIKYNKVWVVYSDTFKETNILSGKLTIA